MADQWYYAHGGERLGPVSQEQLRELASSGQLQASDLVWQEGMADWTPAGEVGGLLPEAAAAGPPPVPGSPPPMRGSGRMQSTSGPGRFLNPLVLKQPYEGEFWTKIVAWSGFGVAFIGICLPWFSVPLGPFGSGSASGWQFATGILAFLFALGGAGVAALPFNWVVLAAGGCGAMVFLMSLVGMLYIPSGGLSFGIFVTMLGGIAAAVGPAAVIFEFGTKKG